MALLRATRSSQERMEPSLNERLTFSEDSIFKNTSWTMASRSALDRKLATG